MSNPGELTPNPLPTAPSHQSLQVRPYHLSDLPEIAQLFYHTVHIVNSKDYNPTQIQAWAPHVYTETDWRERLATADVWVAIAQGQVVGFAELERTGHIDCLYVHHQWQRRGVGAALMGAIEVKANQQHLTRLFAEVSLTAKPFFQAQGFKVVRLQEKVLRAVRFPQFVMEKQLVGSG